MLSPAECEEPCASGVRSAAENNNGVSAGDVFSTAGFAEYGLVVFTHNRLFLFFFVLF